MTLQGIKNTMGQGISTMASGVVSGTKMAAHGVLSVTAEISDLAAKSTWYIGPSLTVMTFLEAYCFTLRLDQPMDKVSKSFTNAAQLILITPVASWAFRRINQLATKANKSF